MNLRCPSCAELMSVRAIGVGRDITCTSCGARFAADPILLVRFKAPSELRITILESDGSEWRGPPVTVMIERGIRLPPLRTDEHGKLLIRESMFLKAEADERETGLMDKFGDCNLVRYIGVRVLSRSAACKLATQRKDSGWPILPFEKSIYGDLPSLLAAYCSSGDLDVVPAYRRLDLHAASSSPEITLVVRRVASTGGRECAV
jgi:hypothetical protein